MVVVPLAAAETDRNHQYSNSGNVDTRYWVRVAAAGSLAASGVLLMAGKRRAGLLVAATGTALVVLDQQDTVRHWWNRMPGYLDEVQSILTRVQGAIDELSTQGERLRTILSK